MSEHEIKSKDKSRFRSLLKGLSFRFKIIAALIIIVIIGAAAIGLEHAILSESKTTKIGFEDIGELATQSAYCTEVSFTDDPRKLFGVAIPFTQSTYVYSYDVIIKAGYNFEEIDWSVKDREIIVKLPEAEILSNQIDLDSLRIYVEDESIFNQIGLEENNEALNKLKKSAETSAIENGLLDNARSNAETILTGFFSSVYDPEEYQIIFKDK